MKIGSFVNRIINNTKSSIVKNEVIEQKEVNVSKLQRITISTTNVDLEVIRHGEPRVHIIFKTYEDGPEMSVNQEEDSLEITVTNPTEVKFFGALPSSKIQLFVPADITEIWDVRTNSGDIEIANMITKSLDVNVGSGDATISEIKAHSANLRCGSGDIIANKLTVEECHVQVSSGDMDIRNLTASHIVAKVGSGDLLLSHCQGEQLELELASGDIHAKDVQVVNGTISIVSGYLHGKSVHAELLTVDSKTGDLDLKDFSGSLTGSTIKGDIFLTVSDDYTINVDSVKGDIDVKIEHDGDMNGTFDITSSDEIDTNLPLAQESNRLTGVIGEGKNVLRAHAVAGIVRVYSKATVRG